MNDELARQRLEQKRRSLENLQSGLRDEETAQTGEKDALSELSSYDQHPADRGTETFEHERNVSMRDRVASELEEIEDALRRLDRGEYGTCEVCGRPIRDDRLEMRPAARFCLDHQAEAERREA